MNVEKKPGSGLTFGHGLDSRAVGIREKPGSGLAFGHGLDSLVVRTSGHWAMPILDKSPSDVEQAEFVSECQT
jgi:hypothetical protein